MNPETFLPAFERLYCDPAVFDSYSGFHPVSFRRVLPFRDGDAVLEDPGLLSAEEAHLAAPRDDTRMAVVDQYRRCGLLSEDEATHLQSVINFFDEDFFNLMGFVYANAGMCRCALRWYRESVAELEARNPESSSDIADVYASVGYCLYSLGLFEEAITWSKSCMGPRAAADTVCAALIDYEAQLAGGTLRVIERAANRTRYTATAYEPGEVSQTTARLKAAMKAAAPFQEIYLDWVDAETFKPDTERVGYPFKAEYDGGNLVRHKMNLIFATCGQADALAARGYLQEARRLLYEAALVEPEAEIIRERIRAIGYDKV